ncbi:reverse transcriptase N-terminal domain-containing protein [Wolbachia endosymbiont (group A) of Longitarsus flavicornis]|uniref:reverse transcriptase N-terminal domain-containing protein n=1 Tax=Wolbachia endosymbiont (group A) of Longitarsus flavicornis TaxID=3066134 RepID=UPI0030CA466C
MVTGKIVSAPFGTAEHWNQINWSQCKKKTRKLQARIVQATKDGRWNKVKTLQHLLTRSFSAKALAVKRVTSNKGKYTAGVDNQLWQSPSAKSQGIASLKRRGYRSQPMRRIYLIKPEGGKRPISIPTIKDRAIQALYLMGLDPVAETIGDTHSYGFRVHRSAADAVSQIFITLARRDAPQWILEGDIKKCFDYTY